VNTILHCTRTEAEAQDWAKQYAIAGWEVNGIRQVALMPLLDLRVLICSFLNPDDIYKAQGLRLNGVIGIDNVWDSKTRDCIITRIHL
jgi:hypothetical protein